MTHNPNSHGRIWRLLTSAPVAALVVLAVARALFAVDEQPASRSEDAPAVLTITGIVKDAFVGRPLEGATVIVYQDTGAAGEVKLVKRFQLVTDTDGKYKFDWRIDDRQHSPQARSGDASDVFPLQIRARHSD